MTGWKYADLSEEQKNKCFAVLPDDWTFGGEPGDQMWPIFICPFCGDECESEFGGCSHFKYVFDSESGTYSYYNGEFFSGVAREIEIMGYAALAKELNSELQDGDLTMHPNSLGLDDDAGLDLCEMYPKMIINAFAAGHGIHAWRLEAAFLPD